MGIIQDRADHQSCPKRNGATPVCPPGCYIEFKYKVCKGAMFPFQVEPNTKLFPAVFVRPTSANLFQFEYVKIKVCI